MEVCSLQVWLHRRQPLLSFKSLSCQFLFVVSSWVYLSFFSTFFSIATILPLFPVFSSLWLPWGITLKFTLTAAWKNTGILPKIRLVGKGRRQFYPSPGWHIEIAVGPRWRGHLWAWNISLWDPEEYCFLTSSPVGQGESKSSPPPTPSKMKQDFPEQAVFCKGLHFHIWGPTCSNLWVFN